MVVETPKPERQLADFMEAARGLTAWRTAQILNRQFRGMDWRGANKGSMADDYVRNGPGDTFYIAEAALEDLRTAKR